MRTTVRLDDHLLARAKRLAADRGTTLTAVIEESLRETIARGEAPRRRPRVPFPTFTGDGLQPHVDLDDSAALLDLMEDRHGFD